MKKQHFYIALLWLSVVFWGCRSNLNEISWETDNTIPLVNTSIRLQDLVDSDSALVFNGNNEAQLILTDTIYRFSNPLDSLVNIEIEPFEKAATLSSLEIADQTAEDTISMVEILAAANITATADSGALPAAFIDFLPPINIPAQQVDFSEYLEEAVLLTGWLDLKIENHTPLVLESATLTVSNTVGGGILYTNTLSNIQPYTSFFQTEDIAASLGGQAIEGDLSISISNVELAAQPAAVTIPIYFADYVSFSATIRDLSVSSATAVFPEQDVIDDRSEVPLLGLDDIELIYAHIAYGRVSVVGFSTLPTPLYVNYKIPSATKGTDTFSFDAIVPAADTLNPTTYSETFELFDYEFDMTGEDGTKFNTFVNHTTGTIDSTGEKLTLSLDDTLYILLQVEQLVPDYVIGYLGQDTIVIGPESMDLSFDGLDITTIDLESALLDIVISNGLGIDGEITIDNLQANSYNSTTEGNTYAMAEAIDNVSASTPVISTINIPDVVNIVNQNPDSLSYGFTLETNPSGNNPIHSDFMHNSAELAVMADIQVPFSFGHTAFTIQTTEDWSVDNDIPAEVNHGTLHLFADNGFPLNAGVKIVFLDSLSGPIDSLTTSERIEAASVDGTGTVTNSTESELIFDIDEATLNEIRLANQVLFEISIEIPDGLGYLKFYSNYSMDLNLVGDFNLSNSAKL